MYQCEKSELMSKGRLGLYHPPIPTHASPEQLERLLKNYEPFGALDAQTRLMMQENLLRIWEDFGTTVMFVTHDVDEAVFLADRVVIMSAAPGRIIDDFRVDIPRPRTTDITTDDTYIQLKRRCMDRIRSESLRAFEQQNH